MKRSLLFIVVLFSAGLLLGQTDIFVETMGNPTGWSNIQPVPVWETNNLFDNDFLTMSGTGTLKNTYPSTVSDYPTASGPWNLHLDDGAWFQIDGINASGYASLVLSFGFRKNLTNFDGSELEIRVSPDGQTWTQIYMPLLPTTSASNGWHYQVCTGAIPASPNLSIRFDATTVNGTWGETHCRIDDIRLTGDGTVPVELSSFTATLTVDNFVNLKWISQSETALAGYYIYRSQNPIFSDALLMSPLISATNSSSQQIYNYTDSELFSNGNYYYWLQSADLDGSSTCFGPVNVFYNAQNIYSIPEIPTVTKLGAAYPNPFNPLVFIPYSLAQDAGVNISIFNNRGQLQRQFELGLRESGSYQLAWDGTDMLGQPAASGVYYIVMNAGGKSFTGKAILMK